MRYQVVAPYVILKVPDSMSGGWTMRGFYRDAIVPDNIDPANLQHHIDGDMVVELAELKPEPVVEPETPKDEEPPAPDPDPAKVETPAVPEKPKPIKAAAK